VLAFLIGFVPPSQFTGGGLGYVLLIGSGVLVIGILAPIALLVFRRPGWRNAAPAEGAEGSS
jgi:hypothetical protein